MTAAGKAAFPGVPAIVLLAAIGITTVVRAVVAGMTGLTDDEAYYRLLASVPAMSYVDHPPMAAWMIAAGRFVAGDNPFGIRLCAVLAPIIGFLALWRFAHILFGEVVAQRAVWFALAMPLLAVGGIVITPDTPSVLFWGLSFWALAELHESGNANWWLVVGLCAGLGLLSKYTNLFVGAGIFLWLSLHPANRRWFFAWQLWAAGALAVAVAMPVVIWNSTHEWASFARQFGRVVKGEGITLKYLVELAGAYLALASPIIAILALAGCHRVTRALLTAIDPARLLLAAGILPLATYFLLHALHSRVQPNWMAPLYPLLAICGALAVEHVGRGRPRNGDRYASRLTQWAAAAGFCLSALLYWHAVRPLVVLPETKDPTSQMRGWSTFVGEVERLKQSSGACWIATASYATAAQLAYNLPPAIPVLQLTERIRYAHLPRIDASLFGCQGLYVELERRPFLATLRARFSEVVELAHLQRTYGGEPIAHYVVYRLARPTGAVLSD